MRQKVSYGEVVSRSIKCLVLYAISVMENTDDYESSIRGSNPLLRAIKRIQQLKLSFMSLVRFQHCQPENLTVSSIGRAEINALCFMQT